MLSRRHWLKGAAALLLVRDALAQGRVEQGVRRVSGNVTVNGQPATQGGVVRSGDVLVTGSNSEIVFVVGRDAMLLREDSSASLVTNGLRVVTGALLSVFAPGGRRQIDTSTAAIGIRGTGVYVESEPERSYVCTCYGVAVLEPRDEPSARETVRTRHHEQPRYIFARGAPQMIMAAPVINHTDAELVMLETLVGRQPPFVGQGYPTY
jgi:hypothetical protein